MAIPSVTNILQQVAVYADIGVAALRNSYCGIATANKKLEQFENIPYNLGTTITLAKSMRWVGTNSLAITFEGMVQRLQTLQITFQNSVGMQFTMLQREFNVEKAGYQFMKDAGETAIAQLGSNVEKDLFLEFISGGVTVDSNQNVTGMNFASGPVRFYGDGFTQLDSFGKLSEAFARFDDFGSTTIRKKCYLPLMTESAIANSGLGQFALTRNNEIAKTWEVGNYAGVDIYRSNLLPTHFSGNVGNAGIGSNVLTVISTNDNTGANITQITFSGATASDVNAIFYGDRFGSVPGVAGLPNLYFDTWVGNSVTQQPVQFRSRAATGADGSGHVVVDIYPGLTVGQPKDDNFGINTNIVAGMKFSVLPTHRVGALVGGDGLYLAMADLPPERPFDSETRRDPDSGVSLRYTYGAKVFMNEQGSAFYVATGHTCIPELSMALIIPA